MKKSVITAVLVGLMAHSTFAQDAPTKPPDALGPGDHTRTLMMGEQKRTYLVHVPKGYDPKKPAPVVLALHGAAMDGPMMVWFSGLNKKSDEAGFIVVYPSGTGIGPFLTWNAGGFRGKMAEGKADDVAFIGKLLDDLGTVVEGGREAGLRLRHEQRGHDVLPAGGGTVRPDRRHRTRGRNDGH